MAFNWSKAGGSAEVMTQQEAIEVLADFHEAFRALNPTKALHATNALLNPGPVMTTGALRARDFMSALNALRTAFDEMEGKGIQFPSK
jgi:hypothetical protein